MIVHKSLGMMMNEQLFSHLHMHTWTYLGGVACLNFCGFYMINIYLICFYIMKFENGTQESFFSTFPQYIHRHLSLIFSSTFCHHTLLIVFFCRYSWFFSWTFQIKLLYFFWLFIYSFLLSNYQTLLLF